MLFRGLKGVNLSCASPASTAVCSAPDRCRSLVHLRSSFTLPTDRNHDKSSQKQPQLPSPSSSSRYLLDEELDELFDAELLPSLQLPSTSKAEGSCTIATTTAAAAAGIDTDLPCDEHVNYLRSAKAAASFHSGDSRTSWVRFHTVDGGDSAAVSRVSWSDDDEGPRRLPLKVVRLGVEDVDKAARDHQVVVLRVSLHCKGCEGKVRKHISRMPGVTSFNIDFASKKVTVIGDVTPLGVLSSISKVKNAQFWPSPPPPSPPPSRSVQTEDEYSRGSRLACERYLTN